ncbi:MAG: hypothetical protein GWP05_07105 [Anaerolineaceae bacterium]|nr:hypothetical protein [Anaerolineaceae bacterium]
MTGRLEQQLDECIERLRQGQSVNDAVASCPDRSGWLRPLLTIVRDLQSLPDPVLSTESMMRTFIKASEGQVEAARAKRPEVRFLSWGFLMRAAAVLLAVFLGGWATVNASADAVPGDWFYPIKRFTERAKFFLTVNQEDKAELRIVFSSERLKEAVKQHQRTGRIDQALLDEMLREARLAAETSETLPDTSRALVAAEAAHASQYQQQMLSSLKTKAAPEQQEILTRYAEMCGQRAQWMQQMCGSGTGPVPGFPEYAEVAPTRKPKS